jgi:hypothetical protein
MLSNVYSMVQNDRFCLVFLQNFNLDGTSNIDIPQFSELNG